MIKRHKIIPASFLFLIKENKILLLRRFNTGFEDGNYSLVAGHVDLNETFSQAIIRESKEEIGIKINSKKLKFVHALHRRNKKNNEERIDVYFLLNEWTGKITNKEPHKCDDLKWFGIDKLPKNIIPSVKQAIQDIKNKKYYGEHGW